MLRLLHAGAKTLSINFPTQISVQRAHKYLPEIWGKKSTKKKDKNEKLYFGSRALPFLMLLGNIGTKFSAETPLTIANAAEH